MRKLPTADEMISHALYELDNAYRALSDAADHLRSDWRPVGSAITEQQSDARLRLLRAIREAKDAINEAKR